MNEYKEVSLVSKFFLSLEFSFKSTIYSKKWLLFIFLSFIPLLGSIFLTNKLLSEDNPAEAFINLIISFFFFYSFGIIIFTLPISSDEIQAHIMDLFFIQPVRREILYIARFLFLVIWSLIINSLIAFIYYVYCCLFSVNTNPFFNFTHNFSIFISVILFYMIAGLVYGSLFLFINFIGERGFLFSVSIAIIEIFFLVFVFLGESPLLPRTHILMIASELFGSYYEYNSSNTLDLLTSLLYCLCFTSLFLVIGIIQFKEKQYGSQTNN